MVMRPALDARSVKHRCDFVALVSRYTRLHPSGRQYVGLCPFHPEQHSSFYVHATKKIYKCFGCDAGGDVFDFVMRNESCDFFHALQLLASSPGLTAGSGAGREPWSVGKRPLRHRCSSGDERARILARLDETDRRLAAIRRTNLLSSRELATACEPLTDAELSELTLLESPS